MPNLTGIRKLGNNLLIAYDDDSTAIAYGVSSGPWYPKRSSETTTTETDDTSLSVVSPLPTTITGTTVAGDAYTFTGVQITRMTQVLNGIFSTPGIDLDALKILMTIPVVESSWRNLSNDTAYPGTDSYPDVDGDGDNYDSLGLFQQRPAAGWGTIAQCLTPSYEGRSFIGGPNGPRSGGSPAGLFDISPAWNTLAPGVAAQNVQVSATPDAYTNAYPVGEAIVSALVTGDGGSTSGTMPTVVIIRSVGSMLFVTFSDGSQHIAYPGNGSLWYITTDFTESSGGGTGGSQPPAGTAGTIDSDELYAYYQANPTNTVGYCEEYWDTGARGASTMGDLDAGELPTAAAAQALTDNVSTASVPDAGFVWFNEPTGDGDVGFIYKGTCYFTDATEDGHVGTLTVAQRLVNLQALHGEASFAGYSDNYLGWKFTEPA